VGAVFGCSRPAKPTKLMNKLGVCSATPTLLVRLERSCEPAHLSFVLCSTYDELPTTANLSRWLRRDNISCVLRNGGLSNLAHFLAECSASQGVCTWKYDRVREVLSKWLIRTLMEGNEDEQPDPYGDYDLTQHDLRFFKNSVQKWVESHDH